MLGDTHIDRKFGDLDVKFRKLNIYDRIKLLKQFKERNRAVLLSDLTAAGASKEELYTELREFGKREYGDPEFVQLFNSTDGRGQIFDMALDELGADEAGEKQRATIRKAMTLTLDETTLLAGEITNIQVIQTEEGGEGSGTDPNSPTGAKPTTRTDDTYEETTPVSTRTQTAAQ